tara:strand:- start:202 stop:795 length:594 start_codon:yes stop_codon:yes gene_type:complete
MQVEQLRTKKNNLLIKGPLLVEPNVFSDDRGFFMESWNQVRWDDLLANFQQSSAGFVQDNHSSSKEGVLRGLHYQIPPHPQGKLVRCVLGEIYDVAVDLRSSSATFLQYVGVHLTSNNFKQLWIPNGFAHGFLTLSKKAEVLYKATDYWDPDCERSICWNDPSISLDWPSLLNPPILSDKDATAPLVTQLTKTDLFQ